MPKSPKSETKFQNKAYSIVQKIPKGKVITYKSVAHALNCKAYRAVGNALNKNRNKKVPCHRVVKSNGKVGKFARGTREKIKLLKREGIKIRGSRILNFERINLIQA